MQVPARTSTLKKRMKQRRSHQAARTPNCRGSQDCEILRNSPRSKPQRCKFVNAIKNPAAFTKNQVEASNVVNGTESWRKLNHQISIIGVRNCASCNNSRLSRFPGLIDSWSHRKIGSKAIAKRKPLAGQPCLTPLAIRNCTRCAPANST